MSRRTTATARSTAAVLIATCALANVGAAQSAVGTSRGLDLNSYAMGTNVLVSSSPYSGVENFVIVFPAPTTFGSSIETDDTFFIRDGNFGLRTQLDDWELGGILSIQTLGYGSGRTPELAGMSRRDWTVQGGVSVGRRFGRFQADVVAQTDLLGEHDGQEYELKMARTFDFGSFYIVPQLDVTYQTSQLIDHYFGVTAGEALPGRPEYRPGGGYTYGASLEWAWKFHPLWFVTADIGIDLLPSEIRASPIVDKDYTYSMSVGFAYDAPTLMEARPPRPSAVTGFEITVGAFLADTDSKIFLTDGAGVVPIDLESDFSLRDARVNVPIDVAWRVNEFHRFEFGYFQLQRSGAGDIVVDIDVGDASFEAGEFVDTSFDTRVLKLGYAFSLLNDTQKELSILGGVHVSDTSYRSASANDSVEADTAAILPMLGAALRINVTERLSVGAELNLFLSDFNRHSGSLIDFAISGQFALNERFILGAGYRLYRQDIDTADEDFFGEYRFQYRGPQIFLKTRL